MRAGGTPHDNFFQALLGESRRAEEVLRAHLPRAVVARLKDTPPVCLDGSFIDEELRGTQSDQLFRFEMTDGRPAYVYVLFEHKSAPDSRTPLQVLKYMIRIWVREAGEADGGVPLPPIIPVVVYHGARPWRVPLSMVDAVAAEDDLRAELRDLRYILLDLGDIRDVELAPDPETRAGLMALKYAHRAERMERLTDILRGLVNGSVLEEQVLAYILKVVPELTPERLRAAIREAKPEQEDRMVSLAAQQWMKEGKAAGLQEGKADAVLLALRTRFQDLGPDVEARIRATSPDQLDDLLQRALTAETLMDVLPQK